MRCFTQGELPQSRKSRVGLIWRVVRDGKLLDFIVDRAQGQERPKTTEKEVVRGSLRIVPLIVGAQRQLAEWHYAQHV